MKLYKFTINGFENVKNFLRLEASIIASQSNSQLPISDMNIDIDRLYRDEVQPLQEMLSNLGINESSVQHIFYIAIREYGSESGTSLEYVMKRCEILGDYKVLIMIEYSNAEDFLLTVQVGGNE